MDTSILDEWIGFAKEIWDGLLSYMMGEDMLLQVGVALGAVLLAYLLNLGLGPLTKRLVAESGLSKSWFQVALRWLRANLFRLLLALLLWSASLYLDSLNARRLVAPEPSPATAVTRSESGRVSVTSTPRAELVEVDKNYLLVRAAASLATLWLVAGALPRQIRDQAYYKTLFFVLSVGLALNLLGIWDAIRNGLDSLKLLPVADGSETRVTALTLVKGMIAILIIIPLSSWILKLSERQIRSSLSVSPALEVLVVKVVKATIVVATILFCISSIGVDLSALAVFGGAIGLGLGFGFQKVVSNLISGVILLADRSIKPGDVIEVDNTYGWINKLSARYVSVITRDGMEHLIPNEILITEKVTNWSFSDDYVRVRVPFGVSWNSDIHKVMDLAVEAGKSAPRVIAERTPVCWLLGFGDNSVDFELRVWIRDPANGINNLRSGIYVKLWDLFKEHGIEIPFPQRDLHIRDGQPLKVQIQRD